MPYLIIKKSEFMYLKIKYCDPQLLFHKNVLVLLRFIPDFLCE